MKLLKDWIYLLGFMNNLGIGLKGMGWLGFLLALHLRMRFWWSIGRRSMGSLLINLLVVWKLSVVSLVFILLIGIRLWILSLSKLGYIKIFYLNRRMINPDLSTKCLSAIQTCHSVMLWCICTVWTKSSKANKTG